jgi:hypothetical protein
VSRVPDSVRARRLYRAIANFQKELDRRGTADKSTQYTCDLINAIADLQVAKERLGCAVGDLVLAEEDAGE